MNQEAGWYPDPTNPAALRFFDGSAWTDSTRPADPSPKTLAGPFATPPMPSDPFATPPALDAPVVLDLPERRSPFPLAIVSAGIALLVGVLVVCAFALSGPGTTGKTASSPREDAAVSTSSTTTSTALSTTTQATSPPSSLPATEGYVPGTDVLPASDDLTTKGRGQATATVPGGPNASVSFSSCGVAAADGGTDRVVEYTLDNGFTYPASRVRVQKAPNGAVTAQFTYLSSATADTIFYVYSSGTAGSGAVGSGTAEVFSDGTAARFELVLVNQFSPESPPAQVSGWVNCVY